MTETSEFNIDTTRGATIGRWLGAVLATIALLASTTVPARAVDCMGADGFGDDRLCPVSNFDRCRHQRCIVTTHQGSRTHVASCSDHEGDRGDPVVCPASDNDPCTGAAACDSDTGCFFQDAANGTACGDNLFCTGSDTCSGGECTHTGDPCAANFGDADLNCFESCNETLNNCTARDLIGSACSDGTFCNGPETCTVSGCMGPIADSPCPGPDGDNDCSESCNETTDSCTANDGFDATCNDGLFCNGTDRCGFEFTGSAIAFRCGVHTGDPCAARVGDPDDDCSESCNEFTDACTFNDPIGSDCSDGTFCNGSESCTTIVGNLLTRVCEGSTGDPCAANVGDGDSDCSESCNETSDACTANDPNLSACASDNQPCTRDVCSAAGACTHPAGNAGTPCREAAGGCDMRELCNGTSVTCPADVFGPATFVCRSAGGDPNGSGFVCDPAEKCTGTSATCPTDVHHDGAICRTGAGAGDFCDPNETCPAGAGSVCGADVKKSAGTSCRAGSGDTCDPAETCTGAARASCPADVRKTAGTVCRAGSVDGTCDPAEVCDGVAGHACPATNVVTAVGTTCRAGSGDFCDPAETCTGTLLAPCPVDVRRTAGTSCRARVDATCDVAENCTGTPGQACPADVGAPAGTVCRAAVDVCDLTEACTGTTCPANQQKPDTDADTRCDEIDNCDLVANLDQADGDSDTVGDVCDNCSDTCNPDQGNADLDADGDVCDVCPAIDEAAEDPECATADYNTREHACCRDSAAGGVSVDADGPACGAAGPASFQTPPDPNTHTTVTVGIPAGAVDGPTSISVTPVTQGGSDFILKTAAGTFVTGAIMEPAGATFDPPLLICMAWEDTDLPLGRVDNLDFGVDEGAIRPTLRDEVANTEVVLGARCAQQEQQGECGALGPDGLPATVPGTLDDPTLAACCSTSANVYCFEVRHFSAYAIAALSCAGEASARIIATRMDKPAGEQDLTVKGEFDLGGAIAGGLDPATSGFELVILSAGGTPLYQVTLPAGAYSRENGEGWKASGRGGKAQWKSKAGISGIDKVKLEWNDATGRGSFDLKGKGISLSVTPADLPLQAEVRLDPSALAGHCGVATFSPPAGICAFNGSGSTLLCQ